MKRTMGTFVLPRLAEFLLSRPRRDPGAVRAMADQQLRRIIAYAYQHVPLYHELFTAHGIDPRDIRTQRDLARLPMTGKNIIVDAGEAALSREAAGKPLDTMQTSGTSGRAIVVRRTRQEMAVMRRAYVRPLFLAGARPRHRFVSMASTWLRSKRGAILRWTTPMRHLLPLDDLDKQIATLESFRPYGLVGQTGGIYLLARELQRRGRTIPLRYVGPTGATLMPTMAQTMRQAFGVAPCDLYGSIELGPITWQCRKANYHIDADRIIVEIVDDDGNPTPPGQVGHVVCTELYSYTMPFIRYRLLDIAAMSTRTCSCGCRFPLMEPVQGRVNDFLPTPRGDLVSPHFFFHIFDGVGRNPVKEWRIRQDRVDEIIYEYVPEESFNPTALQRGMELIRRRFGPTSRVQAVQVDALPISPAGKRNCIISQLRPTSLALERPWLSAIDEAMATDPNATDTWEADACPS
jgi:phenylacetate-CoA ligase